MIYIVHGENQIASRKEALRIASSEGASVVEMRSVDHDVSQVAGKFFSSDLFSSKISLIFNMTKDKNFDYKELIQRFLTTESNNNFIFYSSALIEKSNPVLKAVGELKASMREFKDDQKQSVFALIDALMEKKRKDSYNRLGELLDANEDEFEILSMMVFGLRNLALFHFEAPSFSKLHPFVQQKTTKQAKNFSKTEIVDLYENLYTFDLETKTGKRSPDMALSLMIEKIVG